MKKKQAVVVPIAPKQGRFLRLPPALDNFIVEAASQQGYRSPQEFITDLIRREYQKLKPMAKAA